MSPYLVGSNNSIKFVGSVMLVIHLITACCAYHLPESKGRDLGHTSLGDDDEVDTEGEKEGEMAFRYVGGETQPPVSTRGVV